MRESGNEAAVKLNLYGIKKDSKKKKNCKWLPVSVTLLLVCLNCFIGDCYCSVYNRRASQFCILGLKFHEYRDINNESSKVSKHEQSSLLNMARLFLSPVKSLLFFGGHF